MKPTVNIISFVLLMMLNQAGWPATGNLFTVTGTGTVVTLDITLCLNGKGPLSCQDYTVTRETLSILSAAPNHTYPAAGIKIRTPGYTPSGCSLFSNGYCLFSVSNTTPATITVTSTGTSPAPLAIGQAYEGGVIACLGGAPHLNLIAATTDNSIGLRWSNGIRITTGASSSDAGLANTNTIVTSQGPVLTSYAAGLCDQYTSGGYGDWFLPAADQLACLCANQELLGGGFQQLYWSSTEITGVNSRDIAKAVLFTNENCGQLNENKAAAFIAVRCVRALTL